MSLSSGEVRDTVESLSEANPMLGHRGCRLGLTSPEIYEMQVEAMVGLPDGSSIVRSALAGSSLQPELLGRKVARELLSAGAREIIDSLK